MKRKIIIALVVFTSILILSLFCNRTSVRDLPQILADGRLVVMIDNCEDGYMRDSTGVHGCQYELVKAFADSLGVELLIKTNNLRTKNFKALQSAKFDLLAMVGPKNLERNNITALSPIMATRLMLVQRQQAPEQKIRKQYELDNDTIWVLKNSPFITKLHELADELAIDIEIEELDLDSYQDLFEHMAKGKNIKFTICPEHFVKKYATDFPDFDFSLPLSLKFDLSWYVHAYSEDLKARFDVFIELFKESDDYFALLEKYQYQ